MDQPPIVSVRELTAPAAVISIEIDPRISGGFSHDQQELLIMGRVVASSMIERVSLIVDGSTSGTVHYGRRPGSPLVELPDGSPGTQHLFAFTLRRPRAQATASAIFMIDAHTFDDDAHQETFRIAPDPYGVHAASVVVGPTAQSAKYGGALPPVLLHVEQAVIDKHNELLVLGWALSLTSIVIVQVFADEDRIGVAQLGIARDDVARAHPTFPNGATSGFMLKIAVRRRDIGVIRAQMIDVQGFSHEVLLPVRRVNVLDVPKPAAPRAQPTPPPPPPEPPVAAAPAVDTRREIKMHTDEGTLSEDGMLAVAGWALCAVSIAAIQIYLDGTLVGEAELGLLRPDVAAEYSAIKMARFSGFRFQQKVADSISGEHTLELRVRNGFGDEKIDRQAVRAVPGVPSQPPVPVQSPPEVATQSEFPFEIDKPTLVDHVVQEPITGRLLIEGWGWAPSGIDAIDVFLDNERIGDARYGTPRRDVASAYPERENILRCGWIFYRPVRNIPDGTHSVRLLARAANGDVATREFQIEVRQAAQETGYAAISRAISPVQAQAYHDMLDRLRHHPDFRLVLRQTGPFDTDATSTTLRSLAGQAYQHWNVSILIDTPDAAGTIQEWIAQNWKNLATRIQVIDESQARLVDGPPNSVTRHARRSSETLCGFLCPGDELGSDALAQIAIESGLHRAADLFYADESRISPASHEREVFFKPDWSPDLLLSTNYIGRPWFVTASLLRKTGATPRSLLQNGEFDLVLRCAEHATEVTHVPKLLCHRGLGTLDTREQERAALEQSAARRQERAEILPGCIDGTWRLKRTAPVSGMVSIIIPTCAAHGYIKTCVETLRGKTAYRNFEVICIDNIPDELEPWKVWLVANADKVVEIPETFNWSRFNNLAARQAEGEYLLFLNDDIEITSEDWLDALLEHAQRPDVGVVGPQLVYPDRKVQHAGMFLAAVGTARHAFRMANADDPCYFGLALTQRNVIAVTGACMLVRRTSFDRLGGFDEAHQVVNNDLDYCLRSHRAGYLTVFTPHASLIHHELASRDRIADVFDSAGFDAAWKDLFTAGDPYFNPRLSRDSDDFRPDDEPVQEIFVGHPIGRRDEIRKILAVKVDHIGDFVTAIPAIRRLKQSFPAAMLYVLAGGGARSLAALESSIDEFIEFDFFHARSAHGKKTLSTEDFEELHARLSPYGFDLAVDLRMHLDTRDVLRYTGARFLAGYDRAGTAGFLDITVEWSDDIMLRPKRTHVSDMLINLIGAIETAFDPGFTELTLPACDPKTALNFLPKDARRLFAKPVAAIQPGVGNATRQWPAEHFASLIDLLTRNSGVNVVLIGGPDEAELADSVMEKVANRKAVLSLAGKTSLKNLPTLLSACALYVGNNSGPKHIAAALGVPTIGIHSGVVDAVEWGPLGKRAMALQRDMICGPCFLEFVEDCPRDMACLKHLEPGLVHRYCEMFLAHRIPSARPAPAKAEALLSRSSPVPIP